MSITRRDALGMMGAALAFPGALFQGVAAVAAAPAITPVGAPFRLDGNQTGGQRRGRLSAFTDGRFLATWTQDPPAADEKGWRRVFGLNGVALTGALAGIPAKLNSAAPICFGNTTSLVVGSYDPGPGSRVEARSYNASFVQTAARTIYLPGSSLGQFAVKACRLKSGLVLAAWTDQQGISTMSALGVVLAADGTVRAGGVKPLTNGAETAEQPQAVAALTGGGAVVAFNATTSFKTYTDLLVQRLDASAAQLGAPIRLARYSGHPPTRGIGLIGTSDGGFIAMWSEPNPNGSSKLRWRVYTSVGVLVRELSAANGVDGSVDAGPMLGRMANGKIVAITAAVSGAAGPARRYNVYAWSLLATGIRAAGPVAIYVNTAASHFPDSVAPLNATTVAVAFTGGGTDELTRRAMARRLQIT